MMQFVAERDALAAALSSATKIARKTDVIPLLGTVLLAVDGDKLAITSSDYDTELRTEIVVQGSEDGAACLPAHKLHDIVRAAPDGAQIEIAAVDDSDTRFSVRYGRSRFVMAALPPEDFPLMVLAADAAQSFVIPEAALMRLLAITAPFMGREGGSYYTLEGVYLHCADSELVAVGCDRHRLARAGMPAPGGADDEPLSGPGIIIPAGTVKLLQSLARGDVTLTTTESLMEARWGVTALTTKLVDGTYFDYRQMLARAAENDVTVTADAKEIRACAARVALATSDEHHHIKLDVQPTGTIVFTAGGENGESGIGEMPAETTAPIAVGFNAKLLADAISVCGDDRVALGLRSTTDGAPTMYPCIVSPAGSNAVRLLLSPLVMK